MRPRIKAIAEQAGMSFSKNSCGAELVFGKFEGYKTAHITSEHLQAFARLIALECIEMVENEAVQYAEPTWAFELLSDMHEHFGVKP